jgi:hypothetical protein
MTGWRSPKPSQLAASTNLFAPIALAFRHNRAGNNRFHGHQSGIVRMHDLHGILPNQERRLTRLPDGTEEEQQRDATMHVRVHAV